MLDLPVISDGNLLFGVFPQLFLHPFVELTFIYWAKKFINCLGVIFINNFADLNEFA